MVKLLAILGDYYHPAEWEKECLEEAIRSKFGRELDSEITRYVSNGGGWLAWHS